MIDIHPIWWTAALFAVITAIVVLCSTIFAGGLNSYVPVTLASDRSGLVMETGAKVKLRGVEVGRVSGITGGSRPTRLQLELFPDQVNYIPANVEAQIQATTAFGAKYVDLIYPSDPSPKRISAGAVLYSKNVSTEVNTVFQNLVGVLRQVDVTKLNATLTAIADGVRGQGPRMGQATTDANEVLQAINPRMDTIDANWRSFKSFSDAYAGAAQDILRTLNAASTTSDTVSGHAADLDAMLLSTIGFSQSGTELLGSTKDNLVHSVNALAPTTNLLLTYNPAYTCLLQGAVWILHNGGYDGAGGNGRTLVTDDAVLFGDDPYKYPENLPIVAAKGGPGGQPGCGSLPDPSKNWPVRQLITNTGWGTGVDVRPNPGIGHPWWINFFPVTRGIPQTPSIRGEGPPAPGPAPAVPFGAPYGAPQYGPDGTPLWPGVPPIGAPPAVAVSPPPDAAVQAPLPEIVPSGPAPEIAAPGLPPGP